MFSKLMNTDSVFVNLALSMLAGALAMYGILNSLPLVAIAGFALFAFNIYRLWRIYDIRKQAIERWFDEQRRDIHS